MNSQFAQQPLKEKADGDVDFMQGHEVTSNECASACMVQTLIQRLEM